MKKILFILISFPLLWACSNDYAVVVNGDSGVLVVKSNLDTGVDGKETRTSTDYTTYVLILDGPDGEMRVDFPESGRIINLTPGTYTVTLTSHPDGIPDPAFETPVYHATKTGVVIEEGVETKITLNCVQINAGVFFVYDQTLIDLGLINVTPTVTTEDNKSLVYSGDNKEKKGYFKPGNVTVVVKNGDDILPIGGEDDKTFEIEEKQLWKITLMSTSPNPNGHIVIDVKVEVIDVTNEDEWDLGLNIPVPYGDPFYLLGGEGETVEVFFTDDTSLLVAIDEEGKGGVSGNDDATIKSIKIGSDPEILIGRLVGEEFKLKLDDSKRPAFRDADANGYIPVGTFAELQLINGSATTLAGKYLQEGDIDLMNTSFLIGWYNYTEWYQKPLTGTYDGGGFEIRNIYVYNSNADDNDGRGFVAYNKGTINNVHIASGTIDGKQAVGAVCGYNEGTITNCSNSALITFTGTTPGQNFGGIAGQNNGTVTGCVNKGTFGTVGNTTGGIAGSNVGGTSKIVRCRNEANVTSTASYRHNLGGITGTNEGEILSCINTGDVKSTGSGAQWVGGITGQNKGDGQIRGSYVVADIAASNNLGGLVGAQYSGLSRGTLVSACYFIGNITGSGANKGGICGSNPYNCTLRYSYWSSSTIGAKTGTYTGTMTELQHFTDGTESQWPLLMPDEKGWPSENDAKDWGLNTANDPALEASGKYWKSLGTNGQRVYPKLWWE